MAYRLGGRNSLPYLGVEAPTPANTVLNRRSPTSTDSQNFNIGTWWLKTDAHNEAEEVWILISLSGGVATWVQLYPSGAGGASQFIEDVGVANDLAGVINVFGGAGGGGFININTEGSGNTIEIKLNDTIQWPNTDPTQSQGAIYLGGDRFMHNLGVDSTFLGTLAGPLASSSDGNTGIGSGALNALTTGLANTALGSASGSTITTGNQNILIGFNSGNSYTNEDNNICLANTGTVADSGTIRIGNISDQTICYISGIYDTSITTDTPRVVLQNNTELLGASTLVSTDNSISFTYGANSLDLKVTGSDGNKPSFYASFTNDPEIVFNPNVGPLTGTFDYVWGTVDFLTVPQIMTIVYDNGSNFYPGDGAAAPAYFEAPVTGEYQFNFGVTFGGTGLQSTGCELTLKITNGSTVYIQSIPTGGLVSTFFSNDFGNIRTYSYSYSFTIPMTIGDQAIFTTTTKVVSIGMNQGIRVVGDTTLSPNLVTWISGFQVS